MFAFLSEYVLLFPHLASWYSFGLSQDVIHVIPNHLDLIGECRSLIRASIYELLIYDYGRVFLVG